MCGENFCNRARIFLHNSKPTRTTAVYSEKHRHCTDIKWNFGLIFKYVCIMWQLPVKNDNSWTDSDTSTTTTNTCYGIKTTSVGAYALTYTRTTGTRPHSNLKQTCYDLFAQARSPAILSNVRAPRYSPFSTASSQCFQLLFKRCHGCNCHAHALRDSRMLVWCYK